MTRRALLYVLFGGWLLMALKPGGDADLPIDKWNQLAAFDTAAECESARFRSLSPTGEVQQYAPGDDTPYRIKCVPGDAVYPPAKRQ